MHVSLTIDHDVQFSSDLVRFIPSKKDKWELLGPNFKVGTKLGEGNYGQVYKGTLSLDVSTAPAKSYIKRMRQEGKSSYTVAIKLLKGIYTLKLLLTCKIKISSHALTFSHI